MAGLSLSFGYAQDKSFGSAQDKLYYPRWVPHFSSGFRSGTTVFSETPVPNGLTKAKGNIRGWLFGFTSGTMLADRGP
jgi:hypothetical protein